MFEHMGELLDALDDIPYPPFEMAVRDKLGRVAIVYADEDAVLGILRLPYEDEPCGVATLNADDFPLVRLVDEQAGIGVPDLMERKLVDSRDGPDLGCLQRCGFRCRYCRRLR